MFCDPGAVAAPTNEMSNVLTTRVLRASNISEADQISRQITASTRDSDSVIEFELELSMLVVV